MEKIRKFWKWNSGLESLSLCIVDVDCLSAVVELLTFCVEHHSYHCKNFVVNRNVGRRVLTLLKSPHAFVSLGTFVSVYLCLCVCLKFSLCLTICICLHVFFYALSCLLPIFSPSLLVLWPSRLEHFLLISTILETLMRSENDSRVYFLIVLTTDYWWRSWTSYSGALQILRWLIDWFSLTQNSKLKANSSAISL